MTAAEIFDLMQKYLCGGEKKNPIFIFSDPYPLSDASIKAINQVNLVIPQKISTVELPSAEIRHSQKGEIIIRAFKEFRLDHSDVGLRSPFPEDLTKIEDERHYRKFAGVKYFEATIKDNGEAYITNPVIKTEERRRTWPMTLADIAWWYSTPWYSTPDENLRKPGNGHIWIMRQLMDAIMLAWGERSPIWKDIQRDLSKGTSYASIPVKEIFDSPNKRCLIEKHYGQAGRRCNKDKIGQSIFYARCSMLIKQNELQKLYSFDPIGFKITNRKIDLAEPLSYAMFQLMLNESGTHVIYRGSNEIKISPDLIYDGIVATIRLREKVPLSFKSPQALLDWHDKQVNRRRDLEMKKVTIPKSSRFRKLQLPDNCVRLKTKTALIEEGNYQRNCVATYGDYINRDICSIWSMRLPDGERYTIEIRVNERNRFYINQMSGFGNSVCPAKYIKEIEKCIMLQRACINPRK